MRRTSLEEVRGTFNRDVDRLTGGNAWTEVVLPFVSSLVIASAVGGGAWMLIHFVVEPILLVMR